MQNEEKNPGDLIKKYALTNKMEKIMEKIYKEMEKQEKIKNAITELHELGKPYLKNRNIYYAFFHYFENIYTIMHYFTFFDNCIYFTNNQYVFQPIKNGKNLFSLLQFIPVSEFWDKTYLILKNIIKEFPYPPYYEWVKWYKINNNIFRITPFIDTPQYYFVEIENNLYFKTDGKKLLCITEKSIKEIFKYYKLPLVKESNYKRFFTLMRKTFNLKLENEMSNKNITMDFSYKNHFIKVNYNETKQDFEFEKKEMLYTTCMVKIKEKPKLTNRVVDYLYFISNGKKEMIDKISILFAQSLCNKRVSNKIFLIEVDAKTSNFLPIFLMELIYGKMIEDHQEMVERYLLIECKLHYLSNTRKLSNFINLSINQFPFIIMIHSGKISYTDNQMKLLKKFITGKKIRKEDKVVKQITYTNKAPILVFSNNHSFTRFLENNFTCDRLEVNISNIEIASGDFLDSSEKEWIKLYLCFLGLQQLYEKESGQVQTLSVTKQKNCVNQDSILHYFLDEFCSLDKNVFTYGDDLYQAYQTFYERTYPNEPLKNRPFIRAIKDTNLFDYKRPHVSRTVPNKMAFMGIKIKKEELELYCNQHEKKEKTNPRSIFEEQLNLNYFQKKIEYLEKNYGKRSVEVWKGNTLIN